MALEGNKLHSVIEGCLKGNTGMQKEFYYSYYSTLMKICIRYSGNQQDAEQWVHDGFIKIFANLDSYKFQGSFEGWIKKIMTRTCIDNIRTRNSLKSGINSQIVYNNYEIPDHSSYITDDFFHKFSADDMLLILKTLPEKQKLVFNLHVFEEYNHKEIAGMLDITENHSYWLLHQARKQLKEKFSSLTEKNNSI